MMPNCEPTEGRLLTSCTTSFDYKNLRSATLRSGMPRLTTSSRLVVSTPLKKMKVSWDYDSQYMEQIKIDETTNQVECSLICLKKRELRRATQVRRESDHARSRHGRNLLSSQSKPFADIFCPFLTIQDGQHCGKRCSSCFIVLYGFVGN